MLGGHLCHFIRILGGRDVITQPNVVWVAVIRAILPARWRVVWRPVVGGRATHEEGGENAELHYVPLVPQRLLEPLNEAGTNCNARVKWQRAMAFLVIGSAAWVEEASV